MAVVSHGVNVLIIEQSSCLRRNDHKGVARRNFTKLQANVVKLSLHDQLVLEFRKSAQFLHKGRRQTGRFQNRVQKWVVPPLKLNKGYETEKVRRIFLSTLGMHIVLRLAMMCSAVFSQGILKNKTRT